MTETLELAPIFDEFSDTQLGKAAKEFFANQGLPTKRNEAFHYTDLRQYLSGEIEHPKGDTKAIDFHSEIIIHETQFGEVVSGENNNVRIEPLVLNEFLADDLSSKLTLGLAKRATKITINAKSKARIIINRGAGARNAIIIDVQDGAKLELIEQQTSQSGLSSDFLQVNIGVDAVFKRIMMLDVVGARDIRRSIINVGKNAHYIGFALSFGGKFVRIETDVNLNGEGAKADFNCAYLLDGTQNDFTTNVYHNKPNCETHELVRGMVAKKANSSFTGKIQVERYAQKTIGKMEHRGLMLEEGAKINAKPCLEIYADDVECSHANTIGALDESSLFYMQARGISAKTAKALLTHAFLAEVFDNIEEEDIKEHLLALVDNKLREMIA